MLKVVADESAIRRYQRQFVRSLKTAATDTIPVKLGHPGASEKAKVAWSERLGIWFFSRKIAGSRYWNGFGIGRPEGGGNVAITCEINFPLCGIDRRTGGVFVQDRSGRIFVVHRGKLGGGRKGIGKSLFENRYRGVWKTMDDDGEETTVAVIGVLQSPRFARQIAQFVRKIARIKEAAAAPSPQAELSFEERYVREDLIGERYCEPKSETGAECDHGLIVRDLADVMKKCGLRTVNDGHRDLLILDQKDRIRAVFQILTETTLPDLHAGATQLLLNGLSLPENPLLILCIPRAPENALREKLKRLNIDLLIYQWAEDRAVFPDLDALIPRLVS
ncbi:MAG: hypothetical protein C0390_01200 [Syntrophus sp. (in: bacteria)]|nr:hypothetical protein [Syntrophus sp. (in: bacteria)]